MLTVKQYEVYVLDPNGWTIKSRFTSDERPKAIHAGQDLHHSTGQHVKVVLEEYKPKTNESKTEVVWESSPNIAELSRAPSAHIGKKGQSRSAPARMAAIAEPTVEYTHKRFILRATSMLVLALIGATIASTLVSLSMQSLAPDHDRGIVIIISFIIAFMLFAVPLFMAYVPLHRPHKQQKKKDTNTEAPEYDDMGFMIIKENRGTFWDRLMGREPEMPFQHLDNDDDDVFLADQADDDDDDDDIDLYPEPAPIDVHDVEDISAEEQQDDSHSSADATEEQKKQQAHTTSVKFLAAAIKAIKDAHPTTDSYTRFGINLYIYGACEALTRELGLSHDFLQQLFTETSGLMGTKPETAATLLGQIDGYMAIPRYTGILKAGEQAMDAHLQMSGDPFANIGHVLSNWGKPQGDDNAAKVTTIMFTDMVGSTDITSKIGDAAAQELVRAHNNIVRSALQEYQGTEVKHTGDGIMASFASAAKAVHAAIKIMQQLQAHNHAANTAESLMIRIGLNAGEPIEEDNDYFGASVQTAARVCAAAGSNAIFCAGVVKDLTHGRGFTYFDQGEFRLKGVPETVRLYEVASMAQASPSQPSLSSAVEKVHYQAPHAAPQNSTPAAARQEAQKPALKARPGARPKPRQAP